MAKPALKTEIIDDPFDLGGVELDPNARDKREIIYPFVQWMNGIPKAKLPGYLYVPSKEFSKAGSLPPWQTEEVTFENGDKDSHGLTNSAAEIAIIRSRKRWKSKGQEKTYLPWGASVKGQNMTGQHQYLIALRGCSQLFVLTAGYAASQGIEAAINTHHAQVVTAANKISKQSSNLPGYAFYIKLRGDKFETVGTGKEQKQYAKPSIDLPASVTTDFLKAQFVGKDNLLAFQEAYKEADEWARAWDNVAAMNATDNNVWACGVELAAQYDKLIENLVDAQGDPEMVVSTFEDSTGLSPMQWNEAQMREAIDALTYALRKVKNAAATALQAPSAAMFDDEPPALYADDED